MNIRSRNLFIKKKLNGHSFFMRTFIMFFFFRNKLIGYRQRLSINLVSVTYSSPQFISHIFPKSHSLTSLSFSVCRSLQVHITYNAMYKFLTRRKLTFNERLPKYEADLSASLLRRHPFRLCEKTLTECGVAGQDCAQISPIFEAIHHEFERLKSGRFVTTNCLTMELPDHTKLRFSLVKDASTTRSHVNSLMAQFMVEANKEFETDLW